MLWDRDTQILVVYPSSMPATFWPGLPGQNCVLGLAHKEVTSGLAPLQLCVLDTSLTGPQAWPLPLLTLIPEIRLTLALALGLPVAVMYPCPC